MFYWICFILAVITEVTGTLSMKYAAITGASFGLVIMYVLITCSYVCLAIAIKRIPLGVAYALWEGIGGFFIAIFSVTLLNEPMNALKLGGLLVLLSGIFLVKSGAKKKTRITSSHARKAGKNHAKR